MDNCSSGNDAGFMLSAVFDRQRELQTKNSS